MSETPTVRAKGIWDDNWHLIIVGVAILGIFGIALVDWGKGTPSDAAIQEIAFLQRTAVAQQAMTNQLLRELIKAQQK